MSGISRTIALLFALPVAAAAAPVTITTHTSGSMDPGPDVLAYLGLAVPDGAQPYSLTLSATIDPNAPLFRHQPWRSGVAQTKTQVSVTFDYGQQHLAYTGIGDIFVGNSGGDYTEIVTFPPTDYDNGVRSFDVENYLVVPGQAFADVLAPPTLTDVATSDSGASIQTYINPYLPRGLVGMGGGANTVSVGVTGVPTSPVPEPAHAAMLAAGLLALLGLGRTRRAR